MNKHPNYFLSQLIQMNLSWRLSNAVMCLFFGLASYVQHNDEYALFWMTVYALPCFTSLMTALDLKIIHLDIFHKLMYLFLILYILFSFFLFYQALCIVISSREYNFLAFQQGKEFIGVLIIDTWALLSIYFINVRNIPFDALMTTTAKIVIFLLAISPLLLWAYHGCFGNKEPQLT